MTPLAARLLVLEVTRFRTRVVPQPPQTRLLVQTGRSMAVFKSQAPRLTLIVTLGLKLKLHPPTWHRQSLEKLIVGKKVAPVVPTVRRTVTCLLVSRPTRWSHLSIPRPQLVVAMGPLRVFIDKVFNST